MLFTSGICLGLCLSVAGSLASLSCKYLELCPFFISLINSFLPWTLHPLNIISGHTYCGCFMCAVYLALILLFLFFSKINPAWFAIILVLLSLTSLPRKPSQSCPYISGVEMPGIEHRIPDMTS